MSILCLIWEIMNVENNQWTRKQKRLKIKFGDGHEFQMNAYLESEKLSTKIDMGKNSVESLFFADEKGEGQKSWKYNFLKHYIQYTYIGTYLQKFCTTSMLSNFLLNTEYIHVIWHLKYLKIYGKKSNMWFCIIFQKTKL